MGMPAAMASSASWWVSIPLATTVVWTCDAVSSRSLTSAGHLVALATAQQIDVDLEVVGAHLVQKRSRVVWLIDIIQAHARLCLAAGAGDTREVPAVGHALTADELQDDLVRCHAGLCNRLECGPQAVLGLEDDPRIEVDEEQRVLQGCLTGMANGRQTRAAVQQRHEIQHPRGLVHAKRRNLPPLAVDAAHQTFIARDGGGAVLHERL